MKIDFLLFRNEYEPILDLKSICNTIEISGITSTEKYSKKRYRQFIKDRYIYYDLAYSNRGSVDFRCSRRKFAYVVLEFDNILLLRCYKKTHKMFKKILKKRMYITVHNNRITIIIDYQLHNISNKK